MDRATILSALLETKIIAIIRLDAADYVQPAALALRKGGVRAIEVTVGTPNVFEEIAKLAKQPGIIPGVGSVVDTKAVQAAVRAGAQYIVTPASKREVIEEAHRLGKPVLSGAATPTEILQAYEWGADIIKLFPANFFGLSYFKALQAPMPHIPIMPTGGVSVENAAEWIKNGAVCLGVGSALVSQKVVEEADYDLIASRARKMRAEIDKLNI
ncbi:MAG TPA: bifunctional 4-hydroxy-2-oxoglutarate aldolase/2-dehydro-3-deoxy-phosphogluconate aldolase [Saprospiraceae bacterium]|nr:bifunctional 4-hydroxy-2-oxoglutarate aldolase/2-dehydro-3-deoxy-phosphogluconate aldolase [Saprospiraceae bacterium]